MFFIQDLYSLWVIKHPTWSFNMIAKLQYWFKLHPCIKKIIGFSYKISLYPKFCQHSLVYCHQILPLRTLKWSMIYLRNLGLATTDFDGSLGSLGPALFTTTIPNSLSWPSSTAVTLAAQLKNMHFSQVDVKRKCN